MNEEKPSTDIQIDEESIEFKLGKELGDVFRVFETAFDVDGKITIIEGVSIGKEFYDVYSLAKKNKEDFYNIFKDGLSYIERETMYKGFIQTYGAHDNVSAMVMNTIFDGALSLVAGIAVTINIKSILAESKASEPEIEVNPVIYDDKEPKVESPDYLNAVNPTNEPPVDSGLNVDEPTIKE